MSRTRYLLLLLLIRPPRLFHRSASIKTGTMRETLRWRLREWEVDPTTSAIFAHCVQRFPLSLFVFVFYVFFSFLSSSSSFSFLDRWQRQGNEIGGIQVRMDPRCPDPVPAQHLGRHALPPPLLGRRQRRNRYDSALTRFRKNSPKQNKKNKSMSVT